MRQPPENSDSGRPCAALVEAEAGEDARGARRRCVGVDVDEPGLDFGDAQRVVGAFGLFEQAAAFDVGVEHEVDQRLRAARRLLLDPADAGAAGKADRAALGRELAADQPKQRRFAGAVAADQADVRARRQRDGRPVDQQAFAEPIGELVEMQHGRLFPCAAAAGKGAGWLSRSAACSPNPFEFRPSTGRRLKSAI